MREDKTAMRRSAVHTNGHIQTWREKAMKNTTPSLNKRRQESTLEDAAGHQKTFFRPFLGRAQAGK